MHAVASVCAAFAATLACVELLVSAYSSEKNAPPVVPVASAPGDGQPAASEEGPEAAVAGGEGPAA